MRKRVGVELDTEDPLDAEFLVDFVGVRNRAKWLRGCLLLGYLVATGRLVIQDDTGNNAHGAGHPDSDPSDDSAAARKQKAGKGIGNSLFGIK
jgi:hypothetical protein